MAAHFPDALYVEMGPGNVLTRPREEDRRRRARRITCGTAADVEQLLRAGRVMQIDLSREERARHRQHARHRPRDRRDAREMPARASRSSAAIQTRADEAAAAIRQRRAGLRVRRRRHRRGDRARRRRRSGVRRDRHSREQRRAHARQPPAAPQGRRLGRGARTRTCAARSSRSAPRRAA